MLTRRDRQMMQWAAAGAHIFSTCSRRQYMAVVTDARGRIVGTGYNGAASGRPHCIDGGCPRARTDVPHGSSYGPGTGLCVSVHAEANALMYSNRSDRLGGTLYINGTPCWDCAKLIANSGLGRCVCIDDPTYQDKDVGFDLIEGTGIGLIAVPPSILDA